MSEASEAIQAVIDAALGDEGNCARCERPIEPGQRRVSWFTKDDRNFTTERGAVHLNCTATDQPNGDQ